MRSRTATCCTSCFPAERGRAGAVGCQPTLRGPPFMSIHPVCGVRVTVRLRSGKFGSDAPPGRPSRSRTARGTTAFRHANLCVSPAPWTRGHPFGPVMRLPTPGQGVVEVPSTARPPGAGTCAWRAGGPGRAAPRSRRAGRCRAGPDRPARRLSVRRLSARRLSVPGLRAAGDGPEPGVSRPTGRRTGVVVARVSHRLSALIRVGARVPGAGAPDRPRLGPCTRAGSGLTGRPGRGPVRSSRSLPRRPAGCSAPR